MFRNAKPAAAVYRAQGDCSKDPFISVLSSMDIGEHPACNRTETYMLTNADAIRMYKNDRFIKEYDANRSLTPALRRGPIAIDDYIGDAIEKGENFKPKQAQAVKDMMNYVAIHGMGMTPKLAKMAAKLVAVYHMDPKLAVPLFNKYIGDWGGKSTSYRFDAICDGEVVASVTKMPMTKMQLKYQLSKDTLKEVHSYDVAEIRLSVTDEHENQLYYYGEAASIQTEGPIAVIGPDVVSFRGGATGVYVKTTGETGPAKVIIRVPGMDSVTIDLTVCES